MATAIKYCNTTLLQAGVTFYSWTVRTRECLYKATGAKC